MEIFFMTLIVLGFVFLGFSFYFFRDFSFLNLKELFRNLDQSEGVLMVLDYVPIVGIASLLLGIIGWLMTTLFGFGG